MRRGMEAVVEAIVVGACLTVSGCSSTSSTAGDSGAQAGCPAMHEAGCPAMHEAGCPAMKEAGCPAKEAGCPATDAGHG